jgi:polyisoprenoid-binding protein YceI
MTSSPTSVSDATPNRRRPWLILAAIVVVGAVLVAGGLFWYGFLRPAPAAVSLPSSTSGTAAASATPSAAPTTAASGTTSGSPAPGGSAGAAGADLSGTWTVDTSVGSFSDFTSSFVGYRVQEELANIGAATAVGRTPEVTGSLTLEGTTLTAVELEADVTTLQSDSDMRDGQLRRQGLETRTYPTATFTLTEPIELGEIPPDGQTISVSATGDLTLHGVTNAVVIPLQAQINDGVITVVGSLEIVFADYGMTPPSSMMVLGIDDHGVMEFQIHFSRA